jgi:hypothetical protein
MTIGIEQAVIKARHPELVSGSISPLALSLLGRASRSFLGEDF